jgi:hypothetical protein
VRKPYQKNQQSDCPPEPLTVPQMQTCIHACLDVDAVITVIQARSPVSQRVIETGQREPLVA